MNSNVKTWLGTILGIVLFSLASFFVKQFLNKPPSFDKILVEVVNEINKVCPMIVDSDTQLDNAISKPPNILQYNYTLINYEKEDLDVLELEKNLEPIIVNGIRTNPDMQFLRDKNVVFDYFYKDKNGVFLLKVSVPPEKYK